MLASRPCVPRGGALALARVAVTRRVCGRRAIAILTRRAISTDCGRLARAHTIDRVVRYVCAVLGYAALTAVVMGLATFGASWLMGFGYFHDEVYRKLNE